MRGFLNSIILLLSVNIYLSYGGYPNEYHITHEDEESEFYYVLYPYGVDEEGNVYYYPIMHYYEDNYQREYHTETLRVNGRVEQSGYYLTLPDKRYPHDKSHNEHKNDKLINNAQQSTYTP